MATATAQSLGKVKTPAGDAPVLPLILLGTGGYLVWFAIHYWRRDIRWPSDPVKSVLQGHGLPDPGAAPATAVVDIEASGGAGSPGSGGGGGTTGSVTGQMIADAALKYNGAGYVWGGAPSKGAGNWDCSSFVNWVIGHDLRLSIPQDSRYDGTSHGPDVAAWILWSGVKHITGGAARPGDLLAWGPDEHIGIAISGTHMISAENAQRGTRTDQFSGFAAGHRPLILRLRETLVTAQTGPYGHQALEHLWRLAGGDPRKANTAAAVAQAESGGNPKVTSPNPDGGTNVGLWQLDTKGKGAGHSIAALMKAITNARATVKASRNGTDWSAWATFVSGAYRQYLT
jgi:cell wall-associated NlpC family hydrolase